MSGSWAGEAAGHGGCRGGGTAYAREAQAEHREENACVGFVPHGWAGEGSSFEPQPGVGRV